MGNSGYQVGDRVEIPWTRLPWRRTAGLGALHDPFDGLMSGAAQIGGSPIGPDLVVRRNDVHTLPCRLQ